MKKVQATEAMKLQLNHPAKKHDDQLYSIAVETRLLPHLRGKVVNFGSLPS